jgi:phosphoglycerate dehydrogenase-like enzyme
MGSLLHLDNFIGTLHIGGSTEEAFGRVSETAVDHVLEALAG